jgi:hypothetical protein
MKCFSKDDGEKVNQNINTVLLNFGVRLKKEIGHSIDISSGRPKVV